MTSITATVARDDGTTLYLKQNITYESICSAFLLQLVNESENYATSISCASSRDSTDLNLSYNSDESSFATNVSFSDKSNQSCLASKSQNSSTTSYCSLLKSVVSDRSDCSHMSVSSVTLNQANYYCQI